MLSGAQLTSYTIQTQSSNGTLLSNPIGEGHIQTVVSSCMYYVTDALNIGPDNVTVT